MNPSASILTAPEVTFSSKLLEKFESFRNSSATVTELFNFITTPTAEREEFIILYCHETYTTQDNIIIYRIAAK